MSPSTLPGNLRAGSPAGDQQMWKIIVSPEFGDKIDLPWITRGLIRQMEKDLGTDLEWLRQNTTIPSIHMFTW
jgi:hypothetical protein